MRPFESLTVTIEPIQDPSSFVISPILSRDLRLGNAVEYSKM